MDSEIQIALLGILGTLGGTILGWFLNNLSQHGKLNIFVSSWKDKFEYNETGCMTLSSSIDQTEDYSYNVSFDLYNSVLYRSHLAYPTLFTESQIQWWGTVI